MPTVSGKSGARFLNGAILSTSGLPTKSNVCTVLQSHKDKPCSCLPLCLRTPIFPEPQTNWKTKARCGPQKNIKNRQLRRRGSSFTGKWPISRLPAHYPFYPFVLLWCVGFVEIIIDVLPRKGHMDWDGWENWRVGAFVRECFLP